MCSIVLGLGIMIFGLIALITGKLKFSKNRAVTGVAARLIGIALLIPFPLSFLVPIVYVMVSVDPNKPEQAKAFAQQNETTITIMQAGIEIGLAVLIIIIAGIISKPINAGRGSRRSRDDDDEYEDRPRRKARDRDDEDDRPRRKDDYDDRDR